MKNPRTKIIAGYESVGSQLMSSLIMRFIVITSAQIIATGIVIFAAWAYWQLYAKESWPILLPSLMLAFVVEAGMIFAVFRRQRGKTSLLRLASTITLSWIGGLVSFLLMDPFAKSLYYQTPRIAWIMAVVILFLLVQRLLAQSGRGQS